eukprot:TRINITY_DN899_c0_g1_i1.p1 TRINITY_DN899_c0_g1~~TRINITY_DN899_c0_g1_i1.p1  ORF type:complete len:957 (-),score=240.32 TRINITY_DN899_c0_g1_i1:21-2891(-)
MGKYRAWNLFFIFLAPAFIAVFSFVVYALVSDSVDSQVIFVSLSLFFMIQSPLLFMPMAIGAAADASVSFVRVQEYLNAEELPSALLLPKPEYPEGDPQEAVISIEDGSFYWDSPDRPEAVLSHLSIKINSGKLIGIVGPTGSGKSSLFSALLGEMRQSEETRVSVRGRVAYAAQSAVIFNTTLRDNILFGLPYDPEKYETVLSASCLVHDLRLMPAGDLTEIGERGINLSGGQKQRVSLARALYTDCEIFFLDDILSAVDAHVSKAIFQDAIKGMLKNKTVLMAVNQLHIMPQMDYIYVLKEGKIMESGTYKDLIATGNDFSVLVETYAGKNTDQGEEEESTKGEQKGKAKAESEGALMEREDRNVGVVGADVYRAYIAAAGGRVVLGKVLWWTFVSQFLIVISTWWLGYWSEQDDPDVFVYLSIYLGLNLGMSVCVLVSGYIFAIATPRASLLLHDEMMMSVIHSPMSFFDTTPLGRILNRFSKDIDSIDHNLSFVLQIALRTAFALGGVLVVISVATPLFLIPLLPLLLVFYSTQKLYRYSARELKRLESVSRSPVFAHLSETLTGLVTIRAYSQVERVFRQNVSLLDTNLSVSYIAYCANRWMALRLETTAALLVFFATFFVVISAEYWSISESTAGLSVSYSLQISFYIAATIRMVVDVEAAMTSVERVDFYSHLKQEAPYDTPPAPKAWPATGNVEFREIVLRYREGLSPVLRNISFSIKSGEKIGIVGRTGAGKSSLLLALFRIVEAESGSIFIDGVDISKIGLRILRSSLAILTQNPVLFNGTIRYNVDPMGTASDEKIWESLSLVGLSSVVRSMSLQLDTPLSDGGENLSVGQRQLLCLCRILLKQSRVVVVDEATANVDAEADAKVQHVIRTKFNAATVLIVAHRLNSVIQADRVMVLADGKVVEFDAPRVLLQRPDSVFASLVDETGPANAALLRQLAQQQASQE